MTEKKKVSADGLRRIAGHEGVVLKIYPDQFGYPTAGVGHLLTEAEKASGVFAKGLTYEQAMALFAVDIARFEAIVDELVTVPLTQPQYDALVSLVFNIGRGSPGDMNHGFYESTVRRLLNQGDYIGAANSFWMWRKGGPNGAILDDLVKRREEEKQLFLIGTVLNLGDLETAPDMRIDGLSEVSLPRE